MKLSYDNIVVTAARLFILSIHSSFNLLQRIYRDLQAVYQGVIPPLLGYDRLHKLNTLIYKHESLYFSENYNTRGFWPWEQEAIGEYLSPARRFLVLAAGAGREVIALLSKGIEVDAWECNEKLRAYGNILLEKNNFSCRISPMARSLFPVMPNDRIYNFCIIGWGAYCQIFPREYRIQLLTQCKIAVNGPVLISYLPVYCREGKSKILWSLARKFIMLMPWSFKDVHSDIFIYPHGIYEGINDEKIKSEAAKAGYDVRMTKNSPYAHALLLPDSIK
jgi:hypothetical protein